MPCNGTKYFKPPEFATQDFVKTHQVSMKEHLGTEKYFQLIRELIISQLDISLYDIPLTGHFINCRGSIINWCPIGRNANKEERDFFIKADKENNIRKVVLEELRDMFIIKKLSSDISIKLGGDTSFDIYPTGWDKTYGLTHFQDWDVWFVGDRCEENGNDFEIYEACKGRSFISILGIGTFFNPNLARWINIPGSHTIKAIISTAIGVIIIIISFVVQIPK